MTNRKKRATIAHETLDILERGDYLSPSGRRIRIDEWLNDARENTVLIRPEMFTELFARRNKLDRPSNTRPIRFQVANQTTLAAARQLAAAEDTCNVLCLNFASAKNPGGGFLGGSQAQEESLARSSGLYPCLLQMPQMYETNRRQRNCLYTDHMIYTPGVPVFRDDDGELLDVPYRVAFLTVPAVNAGAVHRNQGNDADRIEPTMIRRMEKLLSVAVVYGHDCLILGAWGCGVFKNDAADVAHWFYDQLVGNPVFRGRFRTVHFAIIDGSEERRFIGPFARRFGGA